MKTFFSLSLCAILALGILFPVSKTKEGPSPFICHIKKIFGFSTGVTGTEGTKRAKEPILHGEKGTKFFQDIGNVFYGSSETETTK